MKNLLTLNERHTYVDTALLLLRVFSAIFLLTHGYPKLQMLFSGEPISFSDPLGIGSLPSLILVVFAEFFCAILLIMGLFTRIAAIPIIINFAVISFVVHSANEFSRKELALMFLLVFIVVFLAGAGRYSMDRLLFGTKKM